MDIECLGDIQLAPLQDTSTGQIIAQHRTRMGTCDAMAQNPWNGVMQLGHTNGVVSMWTPNVTTAIVKMLCHRVRPLPFSMQPHFQLTQRRPQGLGRWKALMSDTRGALWV